MANFKYVVAVAYPILSVKKKKDMLHLLMHIFFLFINWLWKESSEKSSSYQS